MILLFGILIVCDATTFGQPNGTVYEKVSVILVKVNLVFPVILMLSFLGCTIALIFTLKSPGHYLGKKNKMQTYKAILLGGSYVAVNVVLLLSNSIFFKDFGIAQPCGVLFYLDSYQWYYLWIFFFILQTFPISMVLWVGFPMWHVTINRAPLLSSL